MAPTGRAALLAALGSLPVGIWDPGWTGLLAVNAPLAVACACDYALAAPVRTLGLTRSGDTSVRLGDTADVTLTVTNPSRRPLRARVRDAWPPSSWTPGTETEASRHRLTVPAGERRRVTTRLRPTRRGDRQADRVTVRSYGPLGLFTRQGAHKVPWTVRVLPPFTSRKHLPSKLARLRELDGRTSVLTRGEGTEFDSLRAYVPGDDTRSIDWRATARQSEVAVRTWRPERDRHILLVLDTGRTSAGRVGDAPRLDASMDAALLLAALASRARRPRRPAGLRPPGTRPGQGPRGRRRPAVAGERPGPAGARAGGDGRPRPVGGSAPHGYAPLPDRAPDDAGRDAGGGGPAAGPEPADPAPHGPARLGGRPAHRVHGAGPWGHRRGYEAAAAAHAQTERDRTAEQLRRHGVTVVDATPEELAPALADAYLALKAAGRL